MCDPRFKDKKKFVYASSIFLLLLRALGVNASRLLNWLILSDVSKKELLYFKIKLFLLLKKKKFVFLEEIVKGLLS